MSKQRKLSEKEQREILLNNVMDGVDRVPYPTYFFNVGDKVSIGALQDCVVVGVLEDGKVYEIDYTSVNENYGRAIVTRNRRSFWRWYQIRPRSDEVEDHNIVRNSDLRLHYSQRSVDSLFNFHYGNGGVDFNPSYQREYVWEQQDKVNLIRSIFNNIDIGKFVFVRRPYAFKGELHEILDGKQRLLTLIEFYENKLEVDGLTYNDLSYREQRHFDNFPISYAELTNVTEEQKVRYFLMLNTSGKTMGEEHLKKVERMLKRKD